MTTVRDTGPEAEASATTAVEERAFGRADLHIHTAVGDGMAEIQQLLDYVQQSGQLDVIAVTDHDNIQGGYQARELWATDVGREGLGDRLPPDELNVIRRGRHYGWPYCYGNRLPNPEFGDPDRCDVTVPPVLTFPAHSTPHGIAFYTGDRFPAEYRGDAFVALYGPPKTRWARSGFKIVRVRVEAGRPVGLESFVTGWLSEGRAWGRPAVPLVGPDGALYVSDVDSGRVWRVSYRGVGERSVGGGR